MLYKYNTLLLNDSRYIQKRAAHRLVLRRVRARKHDVHASAMEPHAIPFRTVVVVRYALRVLWTNTGLAVFAQTQFRLFSTRTTDALDVFN